MNPVITCTDDGQVYTGPATKTSSIVPYVYNSTTIIQISNSSSESYDCRVTFTSPGPGVRNNPNHNYVANNEPNFTANVTGKLRRVTKFGLEMTLKIFTQSDHHNKQRHCT